MHRQAWKSLLVTISLAVLPACGGELPDDTGAPEPTEGPGTTGRFVRSTDAIPGQYIVVLKGSRVSSERVPEVAQALADGYGGTVIQTYSHELRGFVVRMSEGEARALATLPEVDSVVEDRLGGREQPPGLEDSAPDTGSGALTTRLDTTRLESLASCSLYDFRNYRGQIGQRITCSCPPVPTGNAWGTDLYTDDSSVCVAALHAGVLLPGEGGVIEVTIESGRPRYAGTLRNNITTRSWGTWVGSVSVDAQSCYNYDFTSYRGQNGMRTPCRCGPLPAYRDIWGTDLYTDDSAVCVAAVHAGATLIHGGTAIVTNQPGQASYTGSVRYGMPSLSRGAWGGSISIAGNKPYPSGNCLDYNIPSYRGQNGLQLACSCPAVTGGSAWGTDLYTDDSNVCVAAVHAGAISSGGGRVSITIQPGQASYTGTTLNGITTRSWGAWTGSFHVGSW
ncbi:LCCL domain-containing protein [Pyxidicoccus sp. 3LG]